MDDRAHLRGQERWLETVAARLALAAARPLGSIATQPVLDLMISTLRRLHPSAFERIAEFGPAELLVDPVDLPAVFVLRVGDAPSLRLCPRTDAPLDPAPAATVRGRFAVLLDLFEGRIDGDALFFSRDLAMVGDTELVVGLRNALDGEDFDLAADFASLFGPLGHLPLRRPLVALAGTLLDIHEALLSPALSRLEQIERRLGRLEQGGR